MLKFFDYFFVLRPMLFFPGWSTLLAGYLITSKAQLFYSFEETLSLEYLVLVKLLITFAAAMGGSFLLNQLEDLETDLKNKKLFFLAEKHITERSAILETIILFIVALVIAYIINWFVFIYICVFILITGFAYNYNPFILKNKPIGSLISNALMGWLAFAIGWSAVISPGVSIILDSLPYLFFNTALYLFTTLPDVHGDSKIGKSTLAVNYGTNFVIYLAFLFYLFALITAIWSKDYTALFFILLSLPFFILTLAQKSLNSTIKTTKYAILFFALAICFKIPFYFLLMIAIFTLTKLYFIKRFKYNYPNFKGE